jgi:hypothetical protein
MAITTLNAAELDMVSGGTGAIVVQIHEVIHQVANNSPGATQAVALSNAVAIDHASAYALSKVETY